MKIDSQLSKEQVLLLNNLMYMPDKEPFKGIVSSKDMDVAEVISQIDTSALEGDTDYGSYMTGQDWKNLIGVIQQDEQLMNMKIVETHIDHASNGGGGASALFVDATTNEAVVTFRGTASNEWKDNFTGGGPTNASDGVSTLQQQNALAWYRSLALEQYSTITITGHSKGGNKAKYITIMDDTVDRCLSFDGQGFSDDFISKYKDQIASNQDKIINSNVDSDYVNLLLNDIGKTTFYEGKDYGEGGFLENHCPNTFFEFVNGRSVRMNVSERDERMAVVDAFLNSYLRSLSPEDKKNTLELIGRLVEDGFKQASAEQLLEILLKDKNTTYAADLVAYLIKYKQQHPELVESLNDVLKGMKMQNVIDIINVIDDITEWEYFENLLSGAAWLLDHLPEFVYDKLREYLSEQGINLTNEQLKQLLGMFQVVADRMSDIQIEDNGEDLLVPSKPKLAHLSPSCFQIRLSRLNHAEEKIKGIARQYEQYVDQISRIYCTIDKSFYREKLALSSLQEVVSGNTLSCHQLAGGLHTVCTAYKQCESRIVGSTNPRRR